MLLKYFLSLVLLFVILNASEYPHTFARIATPLFESIEPISKLSSIGVLQKDADEYVVLANSAMKDGYIVDNLNNTQEKKKYLFELRELQKKHDKFLHLLHKKIELSMQENNNKMFFRLLSYEFDGLLKSRALLQRSILFYQSNNIKQKSEFLDKKIGYAELVEATNLEFETKITKSTFSSSDKDSSTKKVFLFVKKTYENIIVFVRNKNPYSITINIKQKCKNLRCKNQKQTFSMKANSIIEYAKLDKLAFDYSYAFSYSWIRGSMDALHDNSYNYRLPYARGTAQRVSQGFNGKVTHKGSNSYAVDFAMNVGTKIYASRDGVVVDTKEDSNRGGFSKEFSRDGNFVVIEHNDATMATYYHLKKDGVRVKIGEKVQRGDHIGYSGNTGYSSGPHLHFQVSKAVNAKRIQSLPIKFISQRGVIIDPKKGSYYKAK